MSDILAEPLLDWFINLLRLSTFSYKEEKSIITAIQSVTIQTYFIDENVLRKKSISTSIQSTTLLRIILRSFHLPFAITTSGFYFRNRKGIWLDVNASCHSENASFPAAFSTRPVGRALWEESLVLSKIHLSIRADEWNFCPLEMFHAKVG